MSRAPDSSNVEESAAELGRVARLLDGSVSRADDLAARGRFVMALAGRQRSRRRWLLAAALATLLGAVIAMAIWRRPAVLEYRIGGALASRGEWLAVPTGGSAVTLEFSEGTQIELGPGSKGRVAEVSASGAHVELGAGLMHARVVPRPRARWVVAAGPYLIEVTGTAFDVGWSAAGEELELSLHDGSVIVRGPSLQDGLRVKAGQRLTASARTGGVALSSLFAPRAAESAAPALAAPAASDKEPQAPAPAPAPTWPELVASGKFRAVIQEAEAKGLEHSLDHGSLSELVALSDAARYLRNQSLSRRGLLAQRARFPGSKPARAAAFMLGRIADDAGASSDALRWYDTYASEAPGGAFAAEALGRKLVVLVRTKDMQTARAVASSYLKRFPGGAHAAYARDLLKR